jgi:hypothetical protein
MKIFKTLKKTSPKSTFVSPAIACTMELYDVATPRSKFNKMINFTLIIAVRIKTLTLKFISAHMKNAIKLLTFSLASFVIVSFTLEKNHIHVITKTVLKALIKSQISTDTKKYTKIKNPLSVINAANPLRPLLI